MQIQMTAQVPQVAQLIAWLSGFLQGDRSSQGAQPQKEHGKTSVLR